MGAHAPLLRVVVPQEDVDQVRLATRAVEVMLPQDMSTTWAARLVREVPAAGRDLPSPALGQRGGGEIVVNPSDDKGLTTMQSLFEFEIALPPEAPTRFLGSRAHVRFTHPPTPIGVRGWRVVRRLFLSQFHV